jgi:manganese transport protein
MPSSGVALAQAQGPVQGWTKVLPFVGPGLMVSVGYMDPGNWATDLEGGARFGYSLLWVLVLSNAIALLLQSLCARLGLVTGRDLAQACREAYPPFVVACLWILCEIAIIACDLAEIIGSAVALNLLFGIPLAWGAVLTAANVALILLLQRHGMRRLEALIGALVLTIAGCLAVELWLTRLDWSEVAMGLKPRLDSSNLYIALAILGATVMPHNLYLHSHLIKSHAPATRAALPDALRRSAYATGFALNLALLVNAALLLMAAATFAGHRMDSGDLRAAHALLAPLLQTNVAPFAFALALLCAGQSATITSTLAGQAVMEGFLNLRMSALARGMLTRGLALLPALGLLVAVGDDATVSVLVATQVVLSVQLPFAVIPLLRFTSSREWMGRHGAPPVLMHLAWSVAVLLVCANGWLVGSTFSKASGPLTWALLVVSTGAVALLTYVSFAPLSPRRAASGAGVDFGDIGAGRELHIAPR